MGSRIKVAREAKRFSQEYMAAMLNITQASYSRLESGITKTNVVRLKKISDLLDLDILRLIYGEDNNVKNSG